MFFRLLHPPFAFEIPDEWLAEAGADDFVPARQSYQSIADPNEIILALGAIAPLLRQPKVIKDHYGFRRKGGVDGGPGGMVDVLQAIVGSVSLPPVTVRRAREISAEGFTYVVKDGFHRFYASHALGFTHLPCVLGTDWQPEAQFGDRL